MLRASVNFAAVMKLLGHTSPEMTLEYLQITQQDLQREFQLARSRPRHLAPQPKLLKRLEELEDRLAPAVETAAVSVVAVSAFKVVIFVRSPFCGDCRGQDMDHSGCTIKQVDSVAWAMKRRFAPRASR
jgi:hypothetical protein